MKILGLIVSLAGVSHAFAPLTSPINLQGTCTRLITAKLEESKHSEPYLTKSIVTMGLIGLLVFTPPAALASRPLNDDWIAPSSVIVADRIVELDMTMPTYGDVKDSKASVANVKSLAKPGTGKRAAVSTPEKSKGQADKNEPAKRSGSLAYDF